MNDQQRALSLKAFSRAIVKAGGQVSLSQILDCSQARISRIVRGESDIPAEMAVRVGERFKVPKWDLRPDLFDRPKGEPKYAYDDLAPQAATDRQRQKAKSKAPRGKSGLSRAAQPSARS